MARISLDTTSDGVVKAMWAEAGIQFRSNMLQTGQKVGLHQHSYDHVMLVTRGRVQVTEISPDNVSRTFEMGAASDLPYRLTMPAYYQHEITCLEGVAEVLCFWPAESADNHEGC